MENEVLKNQLNLVELNLTHEQISQIINLSTKEIEENLENQVKA